MQKQCDWLIDNVNVASMTHNGQAYGAITNAFVAVKNEQIVCVEQGDGSAWQAKERVDGEGQWLLPGFVDCHTHLVFGGDRADEFEQRLLGKSYQQIAKEGGGIQRTVKATRNTSAEELLNLAVQRAQCLLQEGVTTIEVKSGYGLNLETEEIMLQTAQQVSEHLPVSIIRTFLGAHALPPEYAQRPDEYIDYICDVCIPHIAQNQLAQAVDVFCEKIGFSTEQSERVYQAAQKHQLQIKAHVEQLSNLHGAKLAAQYGALSVDHIEYLQAQDMPEIKKHGTVAVILPGAYYFLNETQKPPIQALRDHDIPMAVATDFNPGSSPIASILTCANMACVQFSMTPEEVLKGITSNAAAALGLFDRGTIESGKRADLCLWDIEHPAQLVYSIGLHKPNKIWFEGKRV